MHVNRHVKKYFDETLGSQTKVAPKGRGKSKIVEQVVREVTEVEKDEGVQISSTVPLAKKITHVKHVEIEEPVVQEEVVVKTKKVSKKAIEKKADKDKESVVELTPQSTNERDNVTDFDNSSMVVVKSVNKQFKADHSKSDKGNVNKSNNTYIPTVNGGKSSIKQVSNKVKEQAANEPVVAERKEMKQDDIAKTEIEKFKESYFLQDSTPFNKTVKNNNYYAHDVNGMVIRKSENNSNKTPYGWILLGGKPINIHTDLFNVSLMHTLKKLKAVQPNLFKKPSGTLYRIYKDICNDRYGFDILTV